MSRARYYYRPGHPNADEHGFVEAVMLGAEEPVRALDAPIMVDRFYEGARATDGTDIGSRRRHREYMKQHNLTTADDFSQSWAKAEAERRELRKGEVPIKDPQRREQLGAAMYRWSKP